MKVDKIVYLYIAIIFLGWGLSVFFDKLTTNRLGNRSIIPVIFSTLASFLVLGFFYIFSKKFNYDERGIVMMIIAWFFDSVALIVYFLLFVKTEISWAVPITALYPVIPIVLGIIVLHESLTWTKITGIVLSLGAIIFLSL